MRAQLIGLTALLALLAGCSSNDTAQTSPTDQTSPRSLAGTSWQLVQLESPKDAIGIVRPDDPSKYEMHLGTDGRAAFKLDCNRASGAWTSSPIDEMHGRITFQSVAMTRALCLSGSLDDRIGRELEFMRFYLVEGDNLRLEMMADGGNQLWTRLDQPQ